METLEEVGIAAALMLAAARRSIGVAAGRRAPPRRCLVRSRPGGGAPGRANRRGRRTSRLSTSTAESRTWIWPLKRIRRWKRRDILVLGDVPLRSRSCRPRWRWQPGRCWRAAHPARGAYRFGDVSVVGLPAAATSPTLREALAGFRASALRFMRARAGGQVVGRDVTERRSARANDLDGGSQDGQDRPCRWIRPACPCRPSPRAGRASMTTP